VAHISFLHSFRGGVGKTTVAVNLAGLLASQGRRVGIIETNLQAPGLHYLFGITDPKRTINRYLRGEGSLMEAAYDVSDRLAPAPTATATSPGGRAPAGPRIGGRLFLIPASDEVRDMAYMWSRDVDTELFTQGFTQLASDLSLDILLVDTDPGLDRQTFFALDAADSLVIVMSPDAQGYRGTAAAVHVAQRLKIPTILVVVNKVLPSSDAEAVKGRVASLCGGAATVLLPFAEDVMALASEGLFILQSPDHPFTKALCTVAEQLLVIPERTPAERLMPLTSYRPPWQGLAAAGGPTSGGASVAQMAAFGRQLADLQATMQALFHQMREMQTKFHALHPEGPGTTAPAATATASAMVFDGQNSLVALNPSLPAMPAGVTVEFWALGGDGLPAATCLFASWRGDSERVLNIYLPWEDGAIYWDSGSEGAAYDRICKGSEPGEFKGSWVHWAFVKDMAKGELLIYRGGALWHREAGKTRPITESPHAHIGAFAGGAYKWSGRLAEFRIWDKPRSEQEIRADMGRRVTGQEPGLVGCWPLDRIDANGTTPDATGHRPGTVQGASIATDEGLAKVIVTAPGSA